MASCCSFVGVTDLTALTATVECCGISFRDGGDLISFYNFNNASAISDGRNGLTVRNGVSTLALSEQDLIDLGLTISAIEVAILSCSCVDTQSTLDLISIQSDYLKSFTYLDAGTTDERVETITHSSVSLGSTVVETFTYGGTSPNYYVTSIQNS